jgi:hypothetical protein
MRPAYLSMDPVATAKANSLEIFAEDNRSLCSEDEEVDEVEVAGDWSAA